MTGEETDMSDEAFSRLDPFSRERVIENLERKVHPVYAEDSELRRLSLYCKGLQYSSEKQAQHEQVRARLKPLQERAVQLGQLHDKRRLEEAAERLARIAAEDKAHGHGN